MKLSDIRTTLQNIRVSPAKTLGQNFLHDQNLGRWIIDQAEVTSEDYIVEIGPGLGALTELLLQKRAHVLAIEKDTRLASFLRERFSDSRLEVINADALKFDPRVLFSRRHVKLVGNIPYNISSVLILKFLKHPSPISLWLLMLQKEMALRLSALPRTPNYGSLTLCVQLHHRVKYLRTVPASVFFPKPEIDSALVKLSPRDPRELPPHDHRLLEKLIRRGFSQRRKQLRKLLSTEVSGDWDAAASAGGFDPKARPEELSLTQWIVLANHIAPFGNPDTRLATEERFPIVDHTDRVLGSAGRAEVHGDNLRHRAVHMLIFNQSGELYLQQRSRWKDRHPLKWDSSAAGHVTEGETYEEAARRELQEELGLQLPLIKILKVQASTHTDQEFICLYAGKTGANPRPNPAEIENGVFFPPSIIDSWVAARPDEFAPGFIECWKAYRKTEAATQFNNFS